MCEVTFLQQFNNETKGLHLKAANKLLKRAQTDADEFGIYFPKLKPQYRLANVHDASHATSKTVYAQEGRLVLLMSDAENIRVVNDIVDASDVQKLGGMCHILQGASRKSKRVSQSTSKGETVCA